jgi:hypothetical protein
MKGFDIYQNNLAICRLPILNGIPEFTGYSSVSPRREEVGAYFMNKLGFGYDRSMELVDLFDEFNQYWLSQRPEESRSSGIDLLNTLGASTL